MPVTDSPLRYPGGKTQLSPLILEILRANGISGGVYAEPFAGGAGVAWRLLLNGDVSEVWINDIDPMIYSFWNSVVNSPDPLCEKIQKTKVTMSQWRRQRAIMVDPSASELDRAYATIFLNRTNRSGILKAGVIGGKEQLGEYKLDCRFRKQELVDKIQRISLYREVIRVSRLDAEVCLGQWNLTLPRKGIINIDPPYFRQGRDLYLSFYRGEDHVRLARLIRKLQVPWILTYDDVPEIEQLYAGLPVHRKALTYYAQVKRKASELLVTSPQVNLPQSLGGNSVAA